MRRTLAVDPWDLNDPDSSAVKAALGRRCRICEAKPGERCRSILAAGGPLPGRIVHIERVPAKAGER